MPNLIVMAGPNGAEQGLDDIAAGRQMLQRLGELTKQRKDIAFETTLSSAAMRNRISAMRDAGYLFTLVYVWLPSPEMSIQRVAARVRAGGHHIPENVIRRRYARSLENLFNVFIPLADAWVVLNNSRRAKPSRIAERDVGAPLRVYDHALWDELRKRYMKPTDVAREQAPLPNPSFTMDDVYQAACRAVEEAVARHKALGQSVVVWQDGRPVTLEPEEIEA
jgi:predicted ABC-type ATPase